MNVTEQMQAPKIVAMMHACVLVELQQHTLEHVRCEIQSATAILLGARPSGRAGTAEAAPLLMQGETNAQENQVLLLCLHHQVLLLRLRLPSSVRCGITGVKPCCQQWSAICGVRSGVSTPCPSCPAALVCQGGSCPLSQGGAGCVLAAPWPPLSDSRSARALIHSGHTLHTSSPQSHLALPGTCSPCSVCLELSPNCPAAHVRKLLCTCVLPWCAVSVRLPTSSWVDSSSAVSRNHASCSHALSHHACQNCACAMRWRNSSCWMRSLCVYGLEGLPRMYSGRRDSCSLAAHLPQKLHVRGYEPNIPNTRTPLLPTGSLPEHVLKCVTAAQHASHGHVIASTPRAHVCHICSSHTAHAVMCCHLTHAHLLFSFAASKSLIKGHINHPNELPCACPGKMRCSTGACTCCCILGLGKTVLF